MHNLLLIVERGTHGDLLAMDGLYASMWNRQRVAAEAAERLREVEETDEEGFVRRGITAETREAAE